MRLALCLTFLVASALAVKFSAPALKDDDQVQDVIKNLTITVAEITNALNNPPANHPLEKLIINKLLAVFAAEHVSVASGDITFDQPSGPMVVVQQDCKAYVQLDQGWHLRATLKPDTAVGVILGVGGDIHQPELIVGATVHLDSTFDFAGNIHLAEGITGIPGKKCAVIATENSKETIKGELNIEVNVTLRLAPSLVNTSTGYRIHFTPVVHVAGQLIDFKALVLSHISVYGIPLTKISLLVDVAVNVALKVEITNKLLQKELNLLQGVLQTMADHVWPPGSEVELPDLTPDLVLKVENALGNIMASQAIHYP